jgi:oxalate decarboxylase
VKRNQGHYVQNTGTTDMQFLAVFKSPAYAEISLSNWLTRAPAAMVAQHLNIDPTVLAQFPKGGPGIVPA